MDKFSLENHTKEVIDLWMSSLNPFFCYILRKFFNLFILKNFITLRLAYCFRHGLMMKEENLNSLKKEYKNETKIYAQGNLLTQKYKTALEWYADQARYDVSRQYGGEGWFTEITRDKGRTAREALRN